MTGAYWRDYRAGWMQDTFLARYGMQDIHRLRGVEVLTNIDRAMFAKCLELHMEAEYTPKTTP